MALTQRICRNCEMPFPITESDFTFYKKIDVPEPTQCPDCRSQRRWAFRNERYLFQRTCDLCQKNMLSFFDAEVSFPVYCPTCWWSDHWDPFAYGRDFDFSKSFFEQFAQLITVVPKMGMLQLNNENSEYNTLLAYSKNTYMSPGSYFMEDCYYVRKSQYCKDSLDSLFIDHCELVKDCVNSRNCYQSHHLINCKTCTDSAYMADCIGCQNCFLCANISNQQFCIKNVAYSKEEYQKLKANYEQRGFEDLMKEFFNFSQTFPKKYQNQINCEASSGDYIQNCNNALECYDCFDIEDSKYLIECVTVKDSMDLTCHDKDIERCYEVCSAGESNSNLKFSFCTAASPNSEYCQYCFYLADSFGCDGFHARQSHCILNKKYDKPTYDQLRAKIIEHMKKTGEYGEFFPIALSLHPYNETMAQDYYPLTREQALAKGYRWRDKNPKQCLPATAVLASRIQEIPETIVDELLACEGCGKNYKVIRQELKLCHRLGVTPSRLCADCRSLQLLKLKNPRKLWNRNCAQCGVAISTTYEPNRSEKVFCEKCYLGTL
ncbi:MAG: hypothetical protein UT36_C0002G0024 [Candidatus Peregrinibacteria bacterium GW2011_GWF2_39_17]|nr:MAG: hypothetical protein UT36_C0002G0024 [Candidatus Peregrinibacteria bacterium GW2011_GWF2_39_17]HCW32129.1 hypothetical protein [Candidatus Peregrinibacteria bacterium]